jgi:hypothetical protein
VAFVVTVSSEVLSEHSSIFRRDAQTDIDEQAFVLIHRAGAQAQ